MWALIQMTAVFAAVVFAIRRKAPIGAAMFGGGLAIAGLRLMPIPDIGRNLLEIAASVETADFVGVIGFVAALSLVLQRAGQIDRLSDGFRARFPSPRMTVAVLPSLIGLLPMPGGALFSAPMVGAGARDIPIAPEEKSAINYWFRHVWEYSWPLYPSLLLAIQMADLQMRWVVLAQVPLTVFAFVAGALFLLRGVRRPEGAPAGARGGSIGDIVFPLLPIVIIVGVHLATGWPVVACAGIGFGFGVLWNLLARNAGFADLAKCVFCNPRMLAMLVLGFGARIFAGMMERSGAIGGTTEFLVGLGLPDVLLCALLPFVVGFFAGLNIVFVTTAFPILLALPGMAESTLPYFVLAYAAGHCGTTLSPLHACMTLTAQYFGADLAPIIRRILLPALITLALAGGLLALYLEVL